MSSNSFEIPVIVREYLLSWKYALELIPSDLRMIAQPKVGSELDWQCVEDGEYNFLHYGVDIAILYNSCWMMVRCSCKEKFLKIPADTTMMFFDENPYFIEFVLLMTEKAQIKVKTVDEAMKCIDRK